jgi:exodeoxyribonuclease V alpha subunit
MKNKKMIKLTDQQTAALTIVQKNNLSLLVGYPGTGKTTITREIVSWAKSQDYSIALASPTGKAAHVLSEACNYPAGTIHRLLSPQVSRKHGKLCFHFGYDSDNPLPYTFIIIDECSMIGNDLMSSLLQAIDPEKTKVLLVGDAAQLPSVQPGNILHDLIACGNIPCTELTEVFRHSGAVVDFCTAIRTDTPYDLPKMLDVEAGQNYVHIECSVPQVIHDTIVKLSTVNMIKRGYDTTRDVQILSPVNSKTVLSCDALNESIQGIVNPQTPQDCIENSVFRLGSKVINTKNIYDAISADTNDKEILLNGDCGIITDLQGDKKSMIVQFENPARKIILSKYKHYLKLAYSLTVHRSQGSQFPVVILPVHSTFAYNYNRALLYTAVSRAQDILITVGQRSAIRQAVRSVGVYNRKTMLQEKIENRLLEEL